MEELCSLCDKKIDHMRFDLSVINSKQTNLLITSSIEHLVNNEEFLKDMKVVCKECKDLLIELDMLKGRVVEMENIIKNYIDKKQQYLLCLNKVVKNEPFEEFLDVQIISESSFFEEIVENNSCHSAEELKPTATNCQNLVTSKLHKTTVNNGSKTRQEHICHCLRRFQTIKELEKHILTHENEKPYICEICGQTYKQKTSFNVHMKMHDGLKPYTCIHCDKSFTQKIALIRHIPMHTGKFTN